MTTIQEMLAKKDSKAPAESKSFLTGKLSGGQLSPLNIESPDQAAERTVKNLIDSWGTERAERELGLASEEDYVSKIVELWSQYQRIRDSLDGAVVFVIGDLLNSCRQRFFASGRNARGEKFTEFIEKQAPIGWRQAYDFMAISNELNLFRDKKMGFNKFRALLQLARAGVDMANIASNVENLSLRDLQALRSMTPKGKVHDPVESALPLLKTNVARMEAHLLEFTQQAGKKPVSKADRDEVLKLREKLLAMVKIIDEKM